LPRINTIKCPNQECSSNGFAGGVGKSATAEEKASKAAAKAAEKATKAAEKAASKASKAAEKAAASKKGQTKKTGLSQVLEEQAQAEMEATIAAEDAEQAQIETASGENNREVIYIRYDDTNMKYVYLCVHCDTTWRTDNRL
jgi:hypothetical protein